MKIISDETHLRVYATNVATSTGKIPEGQLLYEIPLDSLDSKMRMYDRSYSKVIVDLSKLDGFSHLIAEFMAAGIQKLFPDSGIDWYLTFEMCGLKYCNLDPYIHLALLLGEGYTHFAPLNDKEGYRLLKLSSDDELQTDYISLESNDAQNILVLNKMECFDIQIFTD